MFYHQKCPKLIQLLILVVCFYLTSSASVNTCEVDGNKYREYDTFLSGLYGCARCVCTCEGVRCDVSECQKLIRNQFEVSSVKINADNTENVASEYPLQYQPDDDAVRDFTQFTANLYKKYLAEKSNSSDYTDFKDQMIGFLAKKDFETHKTANSTQTPCENFAFSYQRFRNLSSYLTRPEYIVNNLHEQRFAGTKEKLNKMVIHSSDSTVVNHSPVRQKATTVSYSVEVTKSVSVTITKTHEFTARAGIEIAFFKSSAQYKFTKTETVTSNTSEKLEVKAPSQKVTLDPFTKMNVTYNFYQYDDINEYFLDFELDEKSMMTHPDFRYMYYGDSNCCRPCFLFKTANVITSPLGTFFNENSDALKSIVYKNNTVVRIEEKNGKFILRNIPAMERVQNFGVDVIYGPVEKISPEQ